MVSMKKLILATAVLLGAATASQAGIRFSFSIGLPAVAPMVACPAPVYTAPAPVYVTPAPVCQAPPALVYAPPPVVYAPAPSIYVGVGSGWCGPDYRWGHYRGWDHGHGHGGWHR